MRTRKPETSHRILDIPRFQTHRENMLAIVARRFGYIETQKILTFQILFDGLKNRREVRRARLQRRLHVAYEKILAARLLRELAKAFARRTHCEASVARREQRQGNH